MSTNRYTVSYEEQTRRDNAVDSYYKRAGRYSKLDNRALYNAYAIGSAQAPSTSVGAIVEAITYTMRTERGYADYEAEQGYCAIFAY